MVVGQTGEYCEIVVIGGGPAGYSAAIRAAQLGRSVTLVERAAIGGVCLNEGCIPSKALLSASRSLSRMRDAASMGIEVEARLDFTRLRSWRQRVVDKLSGGVSQLLNHYGVNVLHGVARFVNDRRIAVERGESFEFVEFGGAVIASGSRPLAPEGITFGESVVSPEQALALERLPARIAVLGGGYIGLELATAYRRLGAIVTVVERGERVLPELDTALSHAVAAGQRRLGIDLRLRTRARRYAEGIVSLESFGSARDGAADLAADIVIAAERRAPNTDDLGLERAGVRLDDTGHIAIDAQCRSSRASICAAGDVTNGPPVAQRGIAQGRIAAEVLAGLAAAYDPAALPLVCFTEPEVMSAGLTEGEAQAAGLRTLSARFPFGASGRAATLNEQQGFLHIVAGAESRRVLGIHAAGPLVSELAGEATLAIELAATLDDLALTIHPHPSLSEAIPEAAWLALDMPLHIARSKREA